MQVDHLRPAEAGQRVYLRSDREGVEVAHIRAQAPRCLGVAAALGVADARQQLARHRRSQPVDQLAPQSAVDAGCQQHAALVAHPDAAGVGREADLLGQVADIGQAGGEGWAGHCVHSGN
nr:F380 [uncultured bacterium]